MSYPNAIDVCRAHLFTIEDVEFEEVDLEFDTLFPERANSEQETEDRLDAPLL